MSRHVFLSLIRRTCSSSSSFVRGAAFPPNAFYPLSSKSQPRRFFASASVSAKPSDSDASPADKNPTAEDDELTKRRKLIEMECYMLQEMGEPAPEVIPENKWEELLKLKSVAARRKYFAYLFKTEKARENRLQKREETKIAKAKHREEVLAERAANEHIVYGLSQNTYLLKVYDRTIDNWGHHRMANAMKFGQPLVLDVGYDDQMTQRETKACAEQLLNFFAANRRNPDPFHLHFCNAGSEGTMKYLERFMPTLREPWLPISLSPDCFTNHYPKEKIVYLTPHCREDLKTWDHDAVYVVGALVDKTKQEPVSLAKAKKLGLRMQRLPLDRYLDWGCGGKSLTVNQMADILLEIKNTGDWKQALCHVPRRKLVKDLPKENRRLPKIFRRAVLDFD